MSCAFAYPFGLLEWKVWVLQRFSSLSAFVGFSWPTTVGADVGEAFVNSEMVGTSDLDETEGLLMSERRFSLHNAVEIRISI